MDQPIDVSWNRFWNLTLHPQPCDAVKRPPSNRAPTQYLSFGEPGRLAGSNRVVQQRPVRNSGLLKARVIGLGHLGPECEIVHMGSLAGEPQVLVGEQVKSNHRIITTLSHGGRGHLGGALKTDAGNCRKKRPLATEVDVGRLVAHAQALRDPTQAQSLHGLLFKQIHGGVEQSTLQRLGFSTTRVYRTH